MRLLVIAISFLISSSVAHSESLTPHPNLASDGQSSLLLSDDFVNGIICSEDTQISDHMGKMGFIIRMLSELVPNLIEGENFESIRKGIIKDTQLLKAHLIAVLPKTPPKVQNIDPKYIQKNKLIYQQYLMKMISYTIEIEAEILKVPANPDDLLNQRVKIAELIIQIGRTVEAAHKQFRF